MFVTKEIAYVGVDDKKLDLFEGMYEVPNGMAYNFYVILDEKIAVMDSVEKDFKVEWFYNLEEVLKGRKPDYLVVQHMEPDHSGNIVAFLDRYPDATVVASRQAFSMMQNFFGADFSDRRMIVGDKDTLSLGTHELQFYTAPMVHWPEVIMTYDKKDKVMFTADAFGKFGTLDFHEDWACEARRYYFGIVGKFGMQVQALLKKIADLDIQAICSLHGPVLKDNLDYYMGLYQTWSSYEPETEGVCICYTSVYGNTKEAVELLAEKLKEKGCQKVVVNDLAREDMAECVEDAFRYSKLVLATTTYTGDIFPFMRTFLYKLTERNFQKRTVAFIENGTWAPIATKEMRSMLENAKALSYTEHNITIRSALTEENRAEISALAEELAN